MRHVANNLYELPTGSQMSGYLDDIFTMTAAAYQKAAQHTAYRLMSGGKTPTFKHGGTWRFRWAKLEHWTASHSRDATEAAGERSA
jgi:hypothetical protein